MTSNVQSNNNLAGALCALAAAFCFSFNDMAVKFVSGDYALHQVVLIRTAVGLVTFLLVIMPFCGGWHVMRTRRPGLLFLRGICLVTANSMLFLSLSVLPIADAVAIYFVLPLIIAVQSVFFLGETVGPRRWTAIVVGFLGVLLIVKPGSSTFQVASLLPAGAALFYASAHILTRRVGATESAATLAFYALVSLGLFSAISGAFLGGGQYADHSDGVLKFLLRAWVPVNPVDWSMLIGLGVTGVFGGFFIGQAYRLSEAAFAAPFEYVSMVLAIVWGVTIFGTRPDALGWIGIIVILGSGLYLVWRETVKGRITSHAKTEGNL